MQMSLYISSLAAFAIKIPHSAFALGSWNFLGMHQTRYRYLGCTISFLSSDVASFFEPSVQCIVKSIKEQCEASDTEISVRNLSGLISCVLLFIDQPAQSLFSLWEVLLRAIGFIKSWKLNLLQRASTSAVLIAMCASPLKHTTARNWRLISNKAVADGAVSFYIDHFVSARVSKYAYGIETYRKFHPSNTEHEHRKNKTFIVPQGYRAIGGIFSVILPQVRNAQR